MVSSRNRSSLLAMFIPILLALLLAEVESCSQCYPRHATLGYYVCKNVDEVPSCLPPSMRKLHLIGTSISQLSSETLSVYPNLTSLRISGDSQLGVLDLGVFSTSGQLRDLFIENCPKLKNVSEPSPDDNLILGKLARLTIRFCALEKIPPLLSLMETTLTLNLEGNKIDRIPTEAFCTVDEEEVVSCTMVHFKAISLRKNFLTEVQQDAFGTSKIQRLDLSDNPDLSSLHENAFRSLSLESLSLSSCGLTRVPKIASKSSDMMPLVLNLQKNKIKTISTRDFCSGTKCPDVKIQSIDLRDNLLESISERAFEGVKVAKIDLGSNRLLTAAHSCSFCGADGLEELILDSTSLSELPYEGLTGLLKLSFADVPTLTYLPSTAAFPKITNVKVTYSMHCCAFQHPEKQAITYGEEMLSCPDGVTESPVTPASNFDKDHHPLAALVRRPRSSPHSQAKPPILQPNAPLPRYVTTKYRTQCVGLADLALLRASNEALGKTGLTCSPQPNAFCPCGDIMEADWLRAFIWLVAIVGVAANMLVLIFSSLVMKVRDTATFLLMNLATADVCMGVYLGAIAVKDVTSRGQYFNYAHSWQYGGGCEALGFLTVFSSELSVFTLCLVTVERWYTIRHAMEGNCMTIRHLLPVMGVGWVLSLTAAGLPLMGVNNYRMTSICLPLSFQSLSDKVYVCSIISVNACGFLVVMVCYVDLFCHVRGSNALANAAGEGDLKIARRMGVLIFSNFVCWGPVIVVAALSAGGVNWPLAFEGQTQLTVAKIVLVIFYPFNSCANPFLYVIDTRKFKRELSKLKKKWGRISNALTGHRQTGRPPCSISSNSSNSGSRSRQLFIRLIGSRAGSIDASVTSTTAASATSPGSHQTVAFSASLQGHTNKSMACSEDGLPGLPTAVELQHLQELHRKLAICQESVYTESIDDLSTSHSISSPVGLPEKRSRSNSDVDQDETRPTSHSQGRSSPSNQSRAYEDLSSETSSAAASEESGFHSHNTSS